MRKPGGKVRERQHFVPNGYLKAWADRSPGAQPPIRVWRLDRKLKRIDLKSPKSILKELHIYSDFTPTGEIDLRYEDFLTDVETAFYAIRPKLLAMEVLSHKEWIDLLMFTAAARVRTQLNRDRHRAQWGPALAMAQDIESRMMQMSNEERATLPRPLRSGGPSLTIDQVRLLVEKPLQVTMVSAIKKLVARFQKMECAVAIVNETERFITSDNPCVFFDPAAVARPPFRAFPRIDSPTLEVSMPLSPDACLFITGHHAGFCTAPDDVVRTVNFRTAQASARILVSSLPTAEDFWLEPSDPNVGIA